MSTDEPNDSAGGAGPDERARWSAFMSALVTEHFVLQSAASTTVSESSGRSTLYLSALSSSLVALGFATQSPRMFAPFAATIIPAIFVLGIFTVVRLVDTGVENLAFLSRIAHIRGYYRRLVPEAPEFFAPWGPVETDEADEALAALSRRRGLSTGFGTSASMIATINSIVAGAGVTLLGVRAFGEQRLPLAVLMGLAATGLCVSAFLAYQSRRYRALRPAPRRAGGAPG